MSPFDLSAGPTAKSDPALIADDEEHFAVVARWLDQSVAELAAQLANELKAPGGKGQQAMERDMQVHRLTARLRVLRRYGLDLCLGRTVPADGGPPTYIGRLGLADGDGRRLLVDWRSPAAEPFFAATHAHPMGLVQRRRYRWSRGRITDYWDEIFAGGPELPAAVDEDSAFLASLGTSRAEQMRDVLGTIAAEQDVIIRAGSRGALVVDGGPGTGKTVVALHRAAYLLYADPRMGHHRGEVLFVGPHQPYLAYVADVLPSLGEEGVQTCTLRDLVSQGATAGVEIDPVVASLKASVRMADVIEAAVRFYEEPPTAELEVETPWADLRLGADDWAAAFDAPEAGTPHNEAREQVWAALLTGLMDQLENSGVPPAVLRSALSRNERLVAAVSRAWPLIDAADLVGDLWSVPAYLRRCAPWLTADEVRTLQRREPQAWTVSDLPLLDAARDRLGDPASPLRRRRHQAAEAEQRAQMARVVEDLLEADDDGEGAVTMLRGEDLRDALVDENAIPAVEPDLLAGPFAHVVVDEAQELTDAEWQMVLRRCPSRSLTIVGDRAQARRGFPESWLERLERIGVGQVQLASLSINYRTPKEVMAEAEPVIRTYLPDANVPTSIRSSGRSVVRGPVAAADQIIDSWIAEHREGVVCVIGDPTFTPRPRVRSLAPHLVKGLEFDLIVLVDPEAFGPGLTGAVDRYVAMTRATHQLVILTRVMPFPGKPPAANQPAG